MCFDERARFVRQAICQVLAGILVHQIRILVWTMVATATGATPFSASDIRIEALRGWIRAQVPLAHGRRGVAAGF